MTHNTEYYQFCKFCGSELIKIMEPYDDVSSSLMLACPNRLKGWRAYFRADRHTSTYIDIVDTVLNFDPFTGERIKRDSLK